MKRASKYNVSGLDNITELTEQHEEERNSAEVRAKVAELHKKARQEMMDGEALDGVSLAQYLRAQQATNKLVATQDERPDGTDIHQDNDPSRVAEEEKRKIASKIIEKWKNFVHSANKRNEETKGSRVKRQKSVRFKTPAEEMESQSERRRCDTENNNENLVTTRIVFPAISRARPSSQHKEKKPSQEYDFLPRLSVKGESSSKIRISPAERFQDRLPPILLTPLSLTTSTPPNSDAGSDSPTSLASTPMILHKDTLKENKRTLKEQVKKKGKQKECVLKTDKTEKETHQSGRKKRNIKDSSRDMNGDTDPTRLKDKSSKKVYPFSAPNSPSCSPRQPTPFPISLSQDSICEVGLSFGRNPTPIWRMKKEILGSAKNAYDKPGREKKRSPRLEEGDTLKTRLDIFINKLKPHGEEEAKLETVEYRK